MYFTSGTQEGTPIDRLLGAIGRRFGVGATRSCAPAGRGKAYFIERLLKDVMLGESGLAGVNRRLEVQKAAAQLGAYAAMAAVAVLGVVAAVGQLQPQPRLSRRRSAADVAALEQAAAGRSRVAARAGRCRVSTRCARSSTRPTAIATSTPWAMRWGLYQGRSIGNAARDAYVRELDGALLPQVAAHSQRLIDYGRSPRSCTSISRRT